MHFKISFLVLLLLTILATSTNAANITATLDEAAGVSVLAVNDSAAIEQCHVDSDGNAVFKGCLRVDSGGVECTVSEGLVVDGNVGIGTTSPAGRLGLPAGSLVTPSISWGSNLAGIFNDGANVLDFVGNGVERMAFNLADPNIKFNSVGSVTWTEGLISGGSDLNLLRDTQNTLGIRRTGTIPFAINVYNTFTDTSNYERFAIDWRTTTNVLRLATEAAGTGVVRNIALMGGNVGIGTTGPGSKLDVTTTGLGTTQTTSSGLALVNTTAAAAGLQQISPAVRWSGLGWKTDATAASQAVDFRSYVVPVQGAANPTGYLSFGSSVNGAAYSDGQLVLTTAGNVGIGAINPRKKLEVLGGGGILISDANQLSDVYSLTNGGSNYGGGSNPPLAVVGDYGANATFLIKSGDGAVADSPNIGLANKNSAANYILGTRIVGVQTSGTAGSEVQDLRFDTQSGGTALTEKMRITGSGNVGIGTTGPVQKLQVAGDVRVGTGTTGCVEDADGTVIAGTCSSDLRLKKNVKPFTGILDKLAQLQPVTFQWREAEFPERHFGRQEQLGLIAQDVEKILPELASQDDKGYALLHYEKLPFYLLEGLRELYALVKGTSLPQPAASSLTNIPGEGGAASPLEGSGAGGGAQSLWVFASNSAPATPPKGQAVIYTKEDGNLYFKNDAGEEKLLSGSRWTPADNGIFYSGGSVGIGLKEKFSLLTLRPPADKTISGNTIGSKGTQIEGVGTHFLSELGVGDRIALSSAPSSYATVMAIDSDTQLSVDQPLGKGFSTNQTISKKSSLFRLEDAGGAVKFMVNDLGWIGIGTALPEAGLHVSSQMKIYNQTPKTGITSLKLQPGEGQANEAILEIQDEKGEAMVTVDAAGKVGIGTFSPESALHVASNQYAQFEHHQKGAPPVEDCKEDHHRGRFSIDTKNNRLYICNGRVRGWDFVGLSD